MIFNGEVMGLVDMARNAYASAVEFTQDRVETVWSVSKIRERKGYNKRQRK